MANPAPKNAWNTARGDVLTLIIIAGLLILVMLAMSGCRTAGHRVEVTLNLPDTTDTSAKAAAISVMMYLGDVSQVAGKETAVPIRALTDLQVPVAAGGGTSTTDGGINHNETTPALDQQGRSRPGSPASSSPAAPTPGGD